MADVVYYIRKVRLRLPNFAPDGNKFQNPLSASAILRPERKQTHQKGVSIMKKMMKNMASQMKKVLTACLIAVGIIAASAATSQAATETTICELCQGNGQSVCGWCDGNGYCTVLDYSYECVSCHGTGITNCLGCLGKGSFTTGTPDPAPAAVPAAGTVPTAMGVPGFSVFPTTGMGMGMDMGMGMGTHMNCPVCNGTGRKVCTSCSGFGFRETRNSSINLGTGSSYYWTKSGCAACSGSGQSMCTHCGGDGML